MDGLGGSSPLLWIRLWVFEADFVFFIKVTGKGDHLGKVKCVSADVGQRRIKI
jgi:hypothetical protein